MMYDYFKVLLEMAEEIGKVDKAELGKYRSGWIDIEGTTKDGKAFNLSLRLEEPKDGND